MAARREREHANIIAERAVYRLVKYRAADLTTGDVTRNRYGKWDVVVSSILDKTGRYVEVGFETGGTHSFRSVHLVDVQVVKPS